MKKIFNVCISILFILFFVLSFKIINSDYYIDITNKEYLNNLFNLTFNYNNLFNNKNNDNMVSNEIKYIKSSDDKYITHSNMIYSIDEGNIYFTIDNVIIKQNDGFDLYIIGDFDLFVFNGDYVDNDSIIGEYYEPFSLFLIKNNVIYTYEEYLRNSF